MGELKSTILISSEGVEEYQMALAKAKSELIEIEKILQREGFRGTAKALRDAAIAYRKDFISAIADIEKADLSRIRRVNDAQIKALRDQQQSQGLDAQSTVDLDQLEQTEEVLQSLQSEVEATTEAWGAVEVAVDGATDSTEGFNEGAEGTEESTENVALGIQALIDRNVELAEILRTAPREGEEGFADLQDTLIELTEEFADNRNEILEFNRSLRRGADAAQLQEGSIDQLRETARDLTRAYNALGEASREGLEGRQLQENLAATNLQIINLSESVNRGSNSVGLYGRAFNGLSNPLATARAGTRQFGAALKVLLANPVVAVLAAIVAALGALFSAFTSTQAGADALERGTAALGAAFDVVRDLAVQLGGFLVSVFSNPLESLETFGRAIVDNVINRFNGAIELVQALGNVIASTLTLDLEGLQSAAGEAGEALTKAATGVTVEQFQSVADGVAAVTNNLIEESTEAARLTGALQGLREEQRGLTVDRSELNAQLVVARDASRDANTPLEERVQILQSISDQETELANREISTQTRRLQALRALANQSDSDVRTRDELAQAEIRLNGLRQQSATRILTVNRQLRQLENQRDKEQERFSQNRLKEIQAEISERQRLLGIVQGETATRRQALSAIANELRTLEISEIEDTTEQVLAREQQRYDLQRRQRLQNFNGIVDDNVQNSEELRVLLGDNSAEFLAFEAKNNEDLRLLASQNNELLEREELNHQEAISKIRSDAAAAKIEADSQAFLEEVAATEAELEEIQRIEGEASDRAIAADLKATIEARERREAQAVELREAIESSVLSTLDNISKIARIAADAENNYFSEAIARRQESINQLNDDLQQATGQQRRFLELRIQQESEAQQRLEQQAEQAQRRQAEAQRIIQVAQAIANTALAVTRALGAAEPPANFILAGAVGAAGAVEIASIASQRFEDGGFLEGNSHAQGGIPFSLKGERKARFEAEGGEIIFSRKSVAYHGKQNLLEMNNQGNRSSFQLGGDVPANMSSIESSLSSGQSRQAEALSNQTVYVNVTDINNLNGKRAIVTDQSNL